MPVERTTPQLVKKGKGKKRPGYRGPGGYQGGRGGSKASSGGSKGTSNTSGAGNQNTGNARDDYRANYSSRSIVKGGGTKKTGGGYNDAKVSGDRARSSAREFVQQLNNNNAVRAAQTGQKFTPYKGGSRPQGGSLGGLGSLIMSGLGMLMGIPGLGLLTGGFGKLKEGLGSLGDKLGDFREKTTGFRTQAEYEQARFDRQQQKRLDKLFAAKDRGYNQIGFGDFTKKTMDFTPGQQAKIDDLLAQGYTPSTARNVLTGRDLKGFTESRGLQTPQTFSNPFANTVGTTTKVNAPASDAVSSYSYGTADAAIPGVETNPSYINEFLNKPRTPGKSSPFSNFIDNLYNSKQILELENQFGSKYGITNTSSGKASDARHMAAMNNLSTSLSPFDNKFGNFIGDTGAFVAGLINELPALGRGFNKQNLGEIVEDIKANYAGSFGTPNQTTAEDIYSNVFEGSTPARTASVPTYGTAAAAEISPTIGMKNTPLGFSIPTGDVGFNTSGRLGNLSATIDAIEALKGESVNPQINYSGTFDNTLLGGQTNVFGNYSDDVQNIGLNFNNDKGLSGGISYDAITGEPRFDIGFRRTFADGGLASMFTRRG